MPYLVGCTSRKFNKGFRTNNYGHRDLEKK